MKDLQKRNGYLMGWRDKVTRKEFFRDLDSRSRLRVVIVTERGKVKRFTVQLETLIGEKWTPVARYDTAHGFAHLDLLHPQGAQDKVHVQEGDFNRALEIAFADLLANAESYISQYLKEI
jgi:hypothetical protein